MTKGKNGATVKKYWIKTTPKPRRASSQPHVNVFVSRLMRLRTAPIRSLMIETHFSLWPWFYSLYTAIPCRYPMALASPISWSFQQNPGFIFKFPAVASLDGLPCRDSLTCLTLADVLNWQKRFHNPFARVLFITLKPEPHGWCCLQEMEYALTPWIIFAYTFIYCCSLGIDNSIGLFFLQIAGLAGCGSFLDYSLYSI